MTQAKRLCPEAEASAFVERLNDVHLNTLPWQELQAWRRDDGKVLGVMTVWLTADGRAISRFGLPRTSPRLRVLPNGRHGRSILHCRCFLRPAIRVLRSSTLSPERRSCHCFSESRRLYLKAG
jgi:hypothetical protein